MTQKPDSEILAASSSPNAPAEALAESQATPLSAHSPIGDSVPSPQKAEAPASLSAPISTQQQCFTAAVAGQSEDKPLRFRETPMSPHEQRLTAYSIFLTGFVIAIFSLVGGFVFGDSYGRRHAQYDNPELREYYAGQCYRFWESQFRQTVRQSLDGRSDDSKTQNSRLEEIQSLLQDIRNDMLGSAKFDTRSFRKRVLSSNSEN